MIGVEVGEERKEWSIVMTGFSGQFDALDAIAEQVFNRRGLDSFSLTLGAKEHLPAEIVNGMARKDAEHAAEQLHAAGAEVEVIRTTEVDDVRHRASEVWADKCVEDFYFTCVDGLIIQFGAISARTYQGLSELQRQTIPGWQIERMMNHNHPGSGDSEERIKGEIEYIDSMKNALSEAYPDLNFTISHRPDNNVSFWQTTEDSPRRPAEGEKLIFTGPDLETID